MAQIQHGMTEKEFSLLMEHLKLRPELVSITAINQFANHNSSARSLMFAAHLSQALTLVSGEEKIVQSGLEKELGKYTFSRKFENNSRIIATIPRYRNGIDEKSVGHVVDAIIIFENLDSDEPYYDVIDVPRTSMNHPYFGFEYKWEHNVLKDLRPNKIVKSGTKVADSPAVRENGGYAFGINANVAMMTDNDVTEDAVVMSNTFVKRMGFKIFERRIVEFGTDSFLLNIYGDEKNYKPFPEIGEYIHETGAIVVKRNKDDLMAPALMSVNDMMEYDTIFDEAVYVRNRHGRVKDIKVYREFKSKHRPISGTCDLADKYAQAYVDYCQSIIDAHEKIKEEHFRKYRNNNVRQSPELTRLITEATIVVSADSDRRPYVKKIFRKEEMDMYRIEFMVEYDLVPGVGYKITDEHGGKSVICHIRNEEDMPTDADGVRADMIVDPASTISRVNIGRLYEGYIAKACRKAKRIIREELLDTSDDDEATAEVALLNARDSQINEIYNKTVLGFLAIFNNALHTSYANVTDVTYKRRLISDIIETEFYVLYQLGDPKKSYDIVKDIESSRFAPTIGPLTYIENGVKRVTRENIIIAPLYIMALAKIADTWLSAASARINHFGMPASAPKSSKHQLPWRNSATRILGETEARLYGAFVGEKFLAELKAMGSSVRSHKEAYRRLLTVDNPSDVDVLVNREEVPYGDDKAIEYISSIFECAGFMFEYTPDNAKYHNE